MDDKTGFMTVEELRVSEHAKAKADGTTLEAKMDELERLTHSKGYADCFRQLYGISTRPDGTPLA